MSGGKTADIEHIVVAVTKVNVVGIAFQKKIRKTTFTRIKQLVLKICGSIL